LTTDDYVLPLPVAEAATSFVRATIDLLRATGSVPQAVPDWPGRWSTAGGSFFVVQPTFRLVAPLPLTGPNSPLRKLPEFADLRTAFESDMWLRNYVDNLVGAMRTSRSRVEFDVLVAEGLVQPLLRQCPDYRVRIDALDGVIADLARELMPREVTLLRAVPLMGFEASRESVLGDNVIVRRLSDDEVGHLLDFGLIRNRQSGPHGVHVEEFDRWAVCDTRPTPRAFGEFDLTTPGQDPVDLSEVADLFRSAARLAVGGAIGRGQSLTLSSGLFGMSRGLSHENRHVVVPPEGCRPAVVRNPATERAVVSTFWLATRHGDTGDDSLVTSIRRFVDARLRHDMVDVLVDLMVALESLLIRDSRHTEIGFRLSLGAALRCRVSEHSPSTIRRFVSRTYDLRSRVVHGAAQMRKLRRIDGSLGTIEQVVDDLELVVAAGLGAAMESIVAGRPSELAWEGALNRLLDDGTDATTDDALGADAVRQE
jgi:hypothetical protein